MPETQIPNDLLVAKILLTISGTQADPYTESLLGGSILALRILQETHSNACKREEEPSVDTGRVGEVPPRPGTVQQGDPQASQAME